MAGCEQRKDCSFRRIRWAAVGGQRRQGQGDQLGERGRELGPAWCQGLWRCVLGFLRIGRGYGEREREVRQMGEWSCRLYDQRALGTLVYESCGSELLFWPHCC